MIVLATTLFSHSAPRVPPPESRGTQYLHLNVRRSGSALQLSWDRDSPVLRGTTRAVLHIEDGANIIDRNLTPAELTAGNVSYAPKGADVAFRIDIYSAAPTAVGSVQLLSPPLVAPLPQPVEHAVSRSPAPLVVREEPPPSAAPSEPPPQRPDVPVRTVSARLDTPPPSPIEKKYETPDRPSSPPRSAGNSTAELFEKTEASLREAAAASRGNSGPEPFVNVIVEPIPQSRLSRVVGKVPLLRRLSRPRSIAPVPVYQAQPSYRLSAGEALEKPLAVDVKVHVGESGAVNGAEVVAYGDPPNLTLANAALTAARQWTFQPAREEDEAVASDVLLRFRFTP